MERIDELENTVSNLQRCLQEVAAGRQLSDVCRGAAQNLKDREILEFLGETKDNSDQMEGKQDLNQTLNT